MSGISRQKQIRNRTRAANSFFKSDALPPNKCLTPPVSIMYTDHVVCTRYTIPLYKAQLASLDFAVSRFFMKLFETDDMNIATGCRMFYLTSSYQESDSQSDVNASLIARPQMIPLTLWGYFILCIINLFTTF